MSTPNFNFLLTAEENLSNVDFPSAEQPQINYAAACALVAIAQRLPPPRDPDKPTGPAPQYIRDLEETLLAMRAERDALVKALIRVKTGSCFCDVGVGLSHRHTPECSYAMSVLSESEAIAAANETQS